MSMHTPAQKQTDPTKIPGVVTLGDYIKQKLEHEPKKLTFEEWYSDRFNIAKGAEFHHYLDCKDTWEAAQKNV